MEMTRRMKRTISANGINPNEVVVLSENDKCIVVKHLVTDTVLTADKRMKKSYESK